MKANDLGRKFDAGDEDILDAFDLTTATRLNRGHKRVNVDVPVWMVDSLYREAGRLGVTRQSIIKIWIAERLENRG